MTSFIASRSSWHSSRLDHERYVTTEAPGVGATEGVREAKNYIDASYGVAFIEGGVERLGVPFPGASFLVGRRSFFSETMFLDGEVGLCFHRSAQANLGWVAQPQHRQIHRTGVRPYPSHLYIQFGTDSMLRRQREPRTLRRLNRRGKDVSELLCGESTFSIEGVLAFLPNVNRRPQHVLPTYAYLESLELIHGNVEPPVVLALTSCVWKKPLLGLSALNSN